MDNELKALLIQAIDAAAEYGSGCLWPEDWDKVMAYRYQLNKELREAFDNE